MDGISYLKNAMDNGIETPLTGAKPKCLECSEPGQAV